MESKSCDEMTPQETEGGAGGARAPRGWRRRILPLTLLLFPVVLLALFPFSGTLTPGSTWSSLVPVIIVAFYVGVVSPLALAILAIRLVGLAKGRGPVFQLHLSTCLTLMFVASLLLWANLVPAIGFRPRYGLEYYGWPFKVWDDMESISWQDIEPVNVLQFIVNWTPNLFTGLTIFGVSAVLLEALTVPSKKVEAPK